MAKRILFFLIAFLVIGLTAVSAQTAAQQQELEQIARRSVNGLSAQDRQRVVQIMTDMFTAQGMSRQQAAQLADMSADSMFMSDVGEMSAEERRQFEEQDQKIQDFEQGQRQLQQVNNAWPSAQAFTRYGKAIQKPSVSFNCNFEQRGDELHITIQSPGYNNFKGFTQAEIREICRVFEAEFGSTGTAYDPQMIWRNEVMNGKSVQLNKQDPNRKNTATIGYYVDLDITPNQSGGQILGFTIIMRHRESSLESAA